MTFVQIHPVRQYRRPGYQLIPHIPQAPSAPGRAINKQTRPEKDTPWIPRADIMEKEHEFVVTIELPGVNENDLAVSIKNNTLTINGLKKAPSYEKSLHTLHCEWRFGRFVKTLGFRAEIVPAEIAAEYTSGVLTITLQKSKDELSQEIPIQFK